MSSQNNWGMMDGTSTTGVEGCGEPTAAGFRLVSLPKPPGGWYWMTRYEIDRP